MEIQGPILFWQHRLVGMVRVRAKFGSAEGLLRDVAQAQAQAFGSGFRGDYFLRLHTPFSIVGLAR